MQEKLLKIENLNNRLANDLFMVLTPVMHHKADALSNEIVDKVYELSNGEKVFVVDFYCYRTITLTSFFTYWSCGMSLQQWKQYCKEKHNLIVDDHPFTVGIIYKKLNDED